MIWKGQRVQGFHFLVTTATYLADDISCRGSKSLETPKKKILVSVILYAVSMYFLCTNKIKILCCRILICIISLSVSCFWDTGSRFKRPMAARSPATFFDFVVFWHNTVCPTLNPLFWIYKQKNRHLVQIRFIFQDNIFNFLLRFMNAQFFLFHGFFFFFFFARNIFFQGKYSSFAV